MTKYQTQKVVRRRVRFLLWRDDLSLRKASKLTGCTYSALANMASLGSVPSPDLASKLAAGFGVSVGFILGMEALKHEEV